MTRGDSDWMVSNHAVWGWRAPVKASVLGVSLLQLSPFFAFIFPLFAQKRLILRLNLKFEPLIGHNLLLVYYRFEYKGNYYESALITPGSKCYYRYDLYYTWVQMLLQAGPLLHLGPNVLTDRTFITLGSKCYYRWDLYYTCAVCTRSLSVKNFLNPLHNFPLSEILHFLKCALVGCFPVVMAYL